MSKRRRAVTITSGGAVSALVIGLTLMGTAGVADAHGAMQNPVGRQYACYLENPESPKSAACKAAISTGGTQAAYDWNGVRIGNAAGRHREIIPDGKLCSAGDVQFRGFDLARADWPATTLTSGRTFTFRYKGTAPHKGGFQLYITKNGYDPTRPLRWSDLEAKPFLDVANPPLQGGVYEMTGTIPAGKTGRHLIYSIWQRSDSPEAFYNCSDVVFGGGGAGAAPAPGPIKNTPGAGTKPKPTPKPTGDGSGGSGPGGACPTPGTGGKSSVRTASVATRPVSANGPGGGPWSVPGLAALMVASAAAGVTATVAYQAAGRRRSRTAGR